MEEGGKGLSGRGEHVQRQGYESKTRKPLQGWSGGEAGGETGQGASARICRAMNGPTREFGPDPVVGEGEPLKNFKQGCDRTRFVFSKAFSGGDRMGQDYGQGAERREWILGTFWRENGLNLFLPKSLFWTFLPFHPDSEIP